MNVEFVYPPDSVDVIESADLQCVPAISDIVNIKGEIYRVYSREWCVFDRPYIDPTKVGVIVNLLKDEVEEHIKKKKGKK